MQLSPRNNLLKWNGAPGTLNTTSLVKARLAPLSHAYHMATRQTRTRCRATLPMPEGGLHQMLLSSGVKCHGERCQLLKTTWTLCYAYH